MEINAAVGIGIPVLIAVIGYLVNAWLERKAQAHRLRIQAYTDLLKGVTGCSAYTGGTPEHRSFSAIHMDARARILAFGDLSVIAAVAAFWGEGASFDTPERQDLFAKLIAAIRKASGRGVIAEATVRRMLLDNVEDIQKRKAEWATAQLSSSKAPAMRRIP